jgi:aspartate kinase
MTPFIAPATLIRVTATEFEPIPEVRATARRPGLVVMKFGGTSVGDVQKIRAVAERLASAKGDGAHVVAVLSAMGDTTDELIALAQQISPRPKPRAYDMLVSVGERISGALAEMALHDMGHEAISFTGSQAGIVTDTMHSKAKIVEIRPQRIHGALDEGKIVLVCGFQGVSTDHEVTTLGRGGSDTTAVALAAALGADACEIYTDVEGVYTADPRLVPDARKLEAVTYEEMLEMAASGARVLQLRSVEFARNHGVRVHVRSTFTGGVGTWIRSEDDEPMLEKAIISGVTHDTSEAKVTIQGVPDRPGIAAKIFRALSDAGVNIDMIVQNVSEQGHTDVSFTLPKDDLANAERILGETAQAIGAAGFRQDPNIAKVSLIGAGMKSHPGVAAEMFETFADEEINIEIISTSSIRISCVVRADDVERAVRALHRRFQLADGGPTAV